MSDKDFNECLRQIEMLKTTILNGNAPARVYEAYVELVNALNQSVDGTR